MGQTPHTQVHVTETEGPITSHQFQKHVFFVLHTESIQLRLEPVPSHCQGRVLSTRAEHWTHVRSRKTQGFPLSALTPWLNKSISLPLMSSQEMSHCWENSSQHVPLMVTPLHPWIVAETGRFQKMDVWSGGRPLFGSAVGLHQMQTPSMWLLISRPSWERRPSWVGCEVSVIKTGDSHLPFLWPLTTVTLFLKQTWEHQKKNRDYTFYVYLLDNRKTVNVVTVAPSVLQSVFTF